MLSLTHKTLILAVVDLGLILFLARRVRSLSFRRLTWEVVVASALFWSIFATLLLWYFWELYYRHFYPGWARWVAPMAGLTYAFVGFCLWYVSQRLPGNPAVNFCLLGGLESVPEHLWGIYGLGIMDRVPGLGDFSPASILVFAVFEYILYWGIVLSVALLLHHRRQWPKL